MKTKPMGTPGNWCWCEGVECGQSTGDKTGTDVVFNDSFKTTSRVQLTPWDAAHVWLTATSTTGFSWDTNKDNTTIDWVATSDSEA